ncbi:RHS repeat-associated core domain-containing protein, partial [Luteolibacter sp.]|uniref:RHS repeat domain-containing protein n=1 Tax=Luteolibacter sp. TaxID=1962973 RepID=UPI003267B83F
LDATNPLRKVNLYGHDLICTDSSSSNQPSTLNHQLSYYSYDGLGSVRGITDENGDLQETYDYDSYGILIGLAKRNPSTGELESAGPTNPAIKPRSEFLYTGEQWDADLGMYFLRARYLNTNTGRFHTPDTYEGRKSEPLSQHKYLYVHANPISGIDPSGHMFLTELSVVEGELIRDKTSDSERVSSEAVPVKNGLKEIINKSGRFTYRSAKKVRDMLPNKELYETHHIIEKRLLDKIPELANLLTESELPAVILEKAEHQVITNAWRAAFPYGIEGAVESSQVIAEAAKIYANYPVLFQSVETILSAL